MNIGVDINNTITEVQDELNKAAYDYEIKLGKNIKNADNSLEDIKNNGDTYKKKFQFSYFKQLWLQDNNIKYIFNSLNNYYDEYKN